MPELSDAQRSRLSLRAKHALWRRGDLSWKLSDNSLAVAELFDKAPRLSTVVDESSRKVGKSYLGLVKTFETLIANPGARSNYACMTGKEAMAIALPLLAEVAADAPPELKPKFNMQAGQISFPQDGPAQGAHVVLFGAENIAMADRGRGPTSVLNVVEEAGFIPVLRYLLGDVLKPQVTYTKGKTLILSSPPLSPGHEFCAIADAAQARGLRAHRNVYTPGGLFETLEEVEEYIESFAADLGLTVAQFRKTSTYKREVLGLRAIDDRLAVVPEFSMELDDKPGVTIADVIVREHPRPAGFIHVDRYGSLDPGMSDFSGGLFGYFDFLASVVVIEDELLLERANTRTIAEAWKAKEAELWPGEAKGWPGLKVRQRVVDDPQQRLVADFWAEHKLEFAPARKDDREAAISLLRVLVGSQRVVIHPRCKHLIHQLRTAIRTKPGGDMARTETDGHFDLVAAAWYLTRHVDRLRNPYPKDFGEPVGLPGMHRVGGQAPPKATPLAQALLGGTSLGRRMLRGGRGRR